MNIKLKTAAYLLAAKLTLTAIAGYFVFTIPSPTAITYWGFGTIALLGFLVTLYLYEIIITGNIK